MGEVINLAKQAYWTKKRNRTKRQEAILEQAMSLPEDEGAQLLFDTWPEHLPKIARGKLSKSLRARWEELQTDAFIEKHFHMELDMMQDEFMDEYIDDLAAVAEERHSKRIDALIESFETSIRGKATFSIGAVIPPMDKIYAHFLVMSPQEADEEAIRVHFHGHYHRENGKAVFTDCQGERIDEEVRGWIGLALNLSGGLSITEELSLKRLAKDEQGNEEWVPQLRNYGVAMSFGEWHPVTAQQAAYARNHDHETGELLPPEPGVSYGELTRPAWMKNTEPYVEHLR